MSPLVAVEWPMALKSASNLREHWAARAKRVKAQRTATALQLNANSMLRFVRDTHVNQLGLRLVVLLTRIAPRVLDDDNLCGAFKGVRDQVAAYFGVDDGNTRHVRWRYAQAKGKPAVRLEFAVESAPLEGIP
jgi:hypothetical protein